MARKRPPNNPRPTGPSKAITRLSRPFSDNPDEEAAADPTGPGDGVAKPPKPVALDSVDLGRLADEFTAEIEHQRAAQETYYQDLIEWDKIYRGVPRQNVKTYPFDHASNVVVKLAKNFSDQVVARIYQGIIGLKPAWMVTELNKKFAETCDPYQRYLDWSQQNMWSQDEFLQAYIQDCVKLGTSIGFIDFVNEPVIKYDDQLKQTIITGYRKGPRPTWVPREDFLIPLGYSDLQRSPWIGHRSWYSWDLLEQLSYQGFIRDLDQLRGHSDEEDEVKVQRRKYQDQVTVLGDTDDRFGLWAPYWVWFRRDLDKDGWPEQYVMLLHPQTKTILRLTANPSPSARRPYVKSAFVQVEGEFNGIGIPEDIASYQDECSTIHNQRRDRSHLSNIVMYIAKMAGQLPDTIRPHSGKVIKTPGGAEDIREFSPAMGQVPIDMAEEDMVLRQAASLVGMNDIDMSRITSPMGRAAATTIMAVQQEQARRFDMNTTQIRRALTEEAHIVTELWQIYGLPNPDQSGSPEQVLDEKEAMLVRALIEQTPSLRGLINIQLNAATAAVNREVEKQSNLQLFGIIQQYGQMAAQTGSLVANPAVPPEIKEILMHVLQGQDKCLDKLFQSFDAFDLESVLASEMVAELFQRSQQQAAMIQQATGMNPTMLAQMQAQQGGQQGGNGGAPKPPNGAGGPPGMPQ